MIMDFPSPRSFTEMVARLRDESEIEDGGTSEDAREELNDLIETARKLTGINPCHPKLFCVDCQLSMTACECDGKTTEVQNG